MTMPPAPGCTELNFSRHGGPTLPDWVITLASLQTLDLRHCKQLQTLPDSLDSLTSLQTLNLGGCSQLQSLPDSLGSLDSLQILDLKYCEQLQSLPDSLSMYRAAWPPSRHST